MASYDDIVCAFPKRTSGITVSSTSAPGYIYLHKSFSVRCESFSVQSMS